MSKVVSNIRAARPPEAYRLPESLQDTGFTQMPLYMQVAWWIFLRGNPATVRDVSEAFHISARRVGDVFLYLNGIDHIDCQRLWVPSPHGGSCRALVVSGVSPTPSPKKRDGISQRRPQGNTERPTRTPRASTGRHQPEDIRILRAWMVSRKPGESVPADEVTSVSEKGEK